MMKNGLITGAIISFLVILAFCGSVTAVDKNIAQDSNRLEINQSTMSATPPEVSLATGPRSSTFTVTQVTGPAAPADNYTWLVNSFPVTRSPNPTYTHQFNTPGMFPVSLIAENYTWRSTHSGDQAQDQKNLPAGTIKATVPIEGFFNNTTVAPFQVYFNYSFNNSLWRGIPTNWRWEFYNSSSPTVKFDTKENTYPNFTYTFPVVATTQTYNVTCRAYNTTGFVVDNYTSKFVAVPTVPLIIANFTATPEPCPAFPVDVVFKDNSTGFLAVDSQIWDYGDGTIEYYTPPATPTHSYNLPGNYSVNYTAINTQYHFQDSTRTPLRNTYVNVTGLLANFTYELDPISGLSYPGVGVNVNFSSTSEGLPTYYDWDFGDNSLPDSNLHGWYANHTYAKSGTYNVTLTAWKPCGGAQISNTTVKAITVRETLIANFTYSPNAGQYPLTVQFTDTSTDSPLRWQWEFYGMGDVVHPVGYSNLQNSTWVYNSPGSYLVTLNVTNEMGNTGMKSQYITLYEGISADFTADKTFGVFPLRVNFTDESTPLGQPTSWTWNFGDNTPGSTIQNANHTYDHKGNFTVSLNAANSQSGDTETKPAFISVGTILTPSFTPTGLVPVRAPFVVNFTDTTTPVDEPSGWKWFFSDGGSANGRTVSHQFPGTGVYSVTLNVSSMYDTRSITNQVNITEVKEPEADFVFSPLTVNAGETVSFEDRSVGPGPMNLSWKFGDGGVSVGNPYPKYTYQFAGRYYPSLTVTNPYGTDTKDSTIPVSVRGPVIPSFITDKPDWWSVINQPVTFIDTSKGQPVSWVWDFNDGTGPFTTANSTIVHTYTRTGIFNVTMTATNWVGDTKMAFHRFEVTDRDVPRNVNFTAVKNYSGPHPLTVQFEDQTPSQSNVIEWYWDYGDRTNEFFTTPTAPTHTYTLPGEYTVTLTVRNAAGVNEKIRVAYVVVV